ATLRPPINPRTWGSSYSDIPSAALSADGKTVAWGGIEGPEDNPTGSAYVWEVDSQDTSPPEMPKEGEEAPAKKQVAQPAEGKELQVFKGHTGRVVGAALSPDGRRVLSGSEDTTVRLWDAATGQELLKMTGHTKKVYPVLFAPENQALSRSEDGTVRLWDLNTGKNIGVFAVRTDVVRSVPHGDKASRDTSIGLRDLETGKVVRTIPNIGNDFHNVCFSAD